MNLTSLTTDNIAEILIRIVKFTHKRQKVLIQNIINVHKPDFVPRELHVDEFSIVVNDAIEEHIRNQRLVLYDTENIKFCVDGDMEVTPIIDEHGEKLLKEDRDEYIEWQTEKLWENSLSQKIAAELLKQKEGAIRINC
jgi:flagellar basal body rod protein FlgB